jgi:PTS system mannose-specific IID component
MQNLGFCFAMIPLLKMFRADRDRDVAFIRRHLQLFNTHPYLSGAIIGSVVREELKTEGREEEVVVRMKNTFMAPYAAMGDPLFGGALKPFCSASCVLLTLMGFVFSPLVYLLLFNPLHFWIRIKAFLAGFREGNAGFQYISKLNLPKLTEHIRWLSLAVVGLLAAYVVYTFQTEQNYGRGENLLWSAAALGYVLTGYVLIKTGISQTVLLYSTTALIMLGSWYLC